MRFGGPMTVGGVSILAPDRRIVLGLLAAFAALAVCAGGFASAQSLYKYRGEDGEWIYADRPPTDGAVTEIRTMTVQPTRATVSLRHRFAGDSIEFVARNRFYAPVELAIVFEEIEGVEYPHPDNKLRWVLEPQSELVLLSLALLGDAAAPSVDYRFDYLPGDPTARHDATAVYRAPFPAGTNYPVTQAFPDAATHRTLDSKYAVDIAMPVGTDVLAARGGIVFDTASNNFSGGISEKKHAQYANFVRILHDDGTYAVYAHLHWNSIRVRPGERVKAGQYIADSGNTGFSSGPHLHFAVQRNAGMRVEAVPVEFRGSSADTVIPATGNVLTAYP